MEENKKRIDGKTLETLKKYSDGELDWDEVSEKLDIVFHEDLDDMLQEAGIPHPTIEIPGEEEAIKHITEAFTTALKKKAE